MTVRIITGDCRDALPTLPADSVHCVVTSPPYWGLRDYGVAGQIGLEATYQDYVEHMVAVFREVRRVLRPDGTLWLNLGDSFDAKAIAEPFASPRRRQPGGFAPENATGPMARSKEASYPNETRNKRSVWEVGTQPFHEAHFATFPPALIEPCILAGCPKGGTVLDPFGGSGTTGLVADRLQRDAILIELKPEYVAMARRRIEGDAPLFAGVF